MQRNFFTLHKRSLGAACLMATSAVGPGFLTQTAYFTESLAASFGFVIFITFIIDLIVQMNIWRIIAASEMLAQDIANHVFPNLGYLLSFLMVLGGIAFNIGNIAGAGLGIHVITGISTQNGAIISMMIAISIFAIKEGGQIMDRFVQVMGGLMLLVLMFIVFTSHPPLKEAAVQTLFPHRISFLSIITIVGGTVGGYITFAGGHRLLALGIKGTKNLPLVTKSALTGITIANLIRVLLFLTALGVVSHGVNLNPNNPAASVFYHASGNIGYIFFGFILWAAAITSVIGAAYTSVSFILTLHPVFRFRQRQLIVAFIVISSAIFLIVGKPVLLLIVAGALNGLILPIALVVMLIAASKKTIVKSYRHPAILTFSGIFATLLMIYAGAETIFMEFHALTS